MKELLIIAIGSAFVNNVVLSQFLGICPFLGVSKKVETASGMGGAVIFVITIASFFTSLIYKFILVPTHFEYLQTIVFILVIAAFGTVCGDVLEKINAFSLQSAWCISSADHDKLCSAWCCPDQRSKILQYFGRCCEWICNCCWVYGIYCNYGRYS